MQSKNDTQHTVSSFDVSQQSICDRIGISIEATDTVDALTRIREAEQAGVRQIWMTSGGAGAGLADPLTLFAAAAAQTESIRLGTAIVYTYLRHPLLMAQEALVVHAIAPGRLRLGIGPGNPLAIEGQYGLPQISPLPYLKEYLEVLRATLWERGADDYHGEFFNIVNVMPDMVTLPHAAQAPLLMSALGKKAFQLAGEISDGALSWMCPIPYLFDQALPALRAGAEARQRPAPPLIAHVPVAISTDGVAVLTVARMRVQMYASFSAYARMFAQAGFVRAVNGDDAGIDALTRALVISGDEATIRQQIQELLESGLDELMLQLIPIADEAQERKQLLQIIGSL